MIQTELRTMPLRNIRSVCLVFALACGTAARPQNFLGINPPGMKWSQIDAPTGRIIFPKGLDSLAFRTAAIMAYEQVHDSTMLGTNTLRRIPAIIQNRTMTVVSGQPRSP